MRSKSQRSNNRKPKRMWKHHRRHRKHRKHKRKTNTAIRRKIWTGII
ncbi:hypothetical protein [Paenimyroides ceti]|nr:hypothetical protein [Paenimyroides ceti]